MGEIHAKQCISDWLIGAGIETLPIMDVLIIPFINTFLSTLPPLLGGFTSDLLHSMQFNFFYLLLLPAD
jgi:hypothetical protein